MNLSFPVPGSIILDASTALAWLIARVDAAEAAIATDALLAVQQSGAIVPELWWAEVCNGALMSERRGGDRNRTRFFLDRLLLLPIKEDPARTRVLLPAVLSTARAHTLTSYDATYLELALRTGSPLATFDRKLASAARAAGVAVFGHPAP